MGLRDWWELLRQLAILYGWLEPSGVYEWLGRQNVKALRLQKGGDIEQATRVLEETLEHCDDHDEKLVADEEFTVTYISLFLYIDLLHEGAEIDAECHDILIRIGEHFVEDHEEYEADVGAMTARGLRDVCSGNPRASDATAAVEEWAVKPVKTLEQFGWRGLRRCGLCGTAPRGEGRLRTETTWSGPVAGTVSRSFDDSFRVQSRSVNQSHQASFEYDADS